MTRIDPSAPSDFDFIIGTWHVLHRRLNARLAGCDEWTEFTGTTTTSKVLQGFGNVEDNVLHFPDGDVRAVALRSFDASTGSWAIAPTRSTSQAWPTPAVMASVLVTARSAIVSS